MLRALMGEYSKSLTDLINLDPPPVAQATCSVSTRTPRVMKVCRSPESGEVIETKGGYHKQLKAWTRVWR